MNNSWNKVAVHSEYIQTPIAVRAKWPLRNRVSRLLPRFFLFYRLYFTAPVFWELNWSWTNRRREYKLLKASKRLNHTPTFLTSWQRPREALLVSFDKKYLKNANFLRDFSQCKRHLQNEPARLAILKRLPSKEPSTTKSIHVFLVLYWRQGHPTRI